ncbi:EF-hand superfamily Ca2+-modulated protein [Amniculicola lignicola CBS 123094]|uniref:Calmodulin n=1 Tax=Amniculicola lignicola CBS 123094 TaxID=1392246 RepID=A0A6A5WEE6_9PLEO|nr:EF-hand superfamily Ca2+-modulated protein [Amniculicola lignicola CBS 123094]
MPPKRRAPSNRITVAPQRPSKLAKEHGLTADQEAEIREAFGLFALQHPHYTESKEGVLRSDDVRRCLISLDLAPDKSELPYILSTIDPTKAGFVPFVPFLSYVAIALQSKSEGDDEDADDEEYQEQTNVEELREAYKLFTHGSSGPITLAHLRRIAKELREDVSDEVLKDMIVEANGGVRGRGNPSGVTLEEFEKVMKRAGLTFG